MQKPMMATGPSYLELVDRGLGVLHHGVPVRVGDELARAGDLVGRVAALEALLGAIEQRRRDRRVAFLRQPIADVADVVVDAEDFLNDHDAAFGRSRRISAIGAQLMAVVCGQSEMFTQAYLL